MQFYTVVACRRDENSNPEIWQTPESWLEVDDDGVVWAHYPFRNRQSCAQKHVERGDLLGGKRWDLYRVSTLYFPEVHTSRYEMAERYCREIEKRPVSDDETRGKRLQNAVLAFRVRHALEERIP